MSMVKAEKCRMSSISSVSERSRDNASPIGAIVTECLTSFGRVISMKSTTCRSLGREFITSIVF